MLIPPIATLLVPPLQREERSGTGGYSRPPPRAVVGGVSAPTPMPDVPPGPVITTTQMTSTMIQSQETSSEGVQRYG